MWVSLLRLRSGACSKNSSKRGTFFPYNKMSSSSPGRSQELKFLLDPTAPTPLVVPNPYGSKNGFLQSRHHGHVLPAFKDKTEASMAESIL